MNYTIREVSEMLNIPISTIRYYENVELLPPIQRIEEKRIFTEENIATLKKIKNLKEMGMTLKNIKSFNQLYCDEQGSIKQKVAMLCQQHDLIKEQIKNLQKTLTIIEQECTKYLGCN